MGQELNDGVGNYLRMLWLRFLVVSELMERSGPVADVVRSAGDVTQSRGRERGRGAVQCR